MVTECAAGQGGPSRRCIASRRERPSAEMLRFVVDPDGWIVADIGGKLPGRGFWLSADRDMIHTACARNLFARAARAKVRVPADLAERVEKLLLKRCLDHIGLARRAGQAVAGFVKVEAWLKAGKGAGALLAASDGAASGRAKLAALGRAAAVGVTPVGSLDSAELGLAFGREKAVHAVLAKGRLADKLLLDAKRLDGLRGLGGTGGEGAGLESGVRSETFRSGT